MNRARNLIFTLFFFGLLTPLGVFAAGYDIVNIKTSPKVPGPNEDVTVSLESFAVDLGRSTIVWYVNREPKQQGIALKTLVVHTGELGQKMIVDIVILTPAGEKLDKQITIAPAEVDVLWEAQTYTPPFYKGKALAGYKSLVRVTAIPRYNSFSSDPSQYYYKWTFNRTQGLGEAKGKSSVVIPMGWSDSSVPVTVETSLEGTEFKGSKSVNIPGGEAKVIFYEQAPLLGTQFNHALSGEVTAGGNSLTIRAVPYFFSLDNYMNEDLLYTWQVNRRNVIPAPDKNTLTLTKEGKGAEAYSVNLRVQNPKRILQDGSSAAVVGFNAEE